MDVLLCAADTTYGGTKRSNHELNGRRCVTAKLQKNVKKKYPENVFEVVL